MVVALALHLLCRGCKPQQITILTAYLGQTKILRQMLRGAIEKFRLYDDNMISVQTIDMYQGDENEYVIVSLVRSCVNSIGFLDSMNRRCVAQSRAKCGLYYVGNVTTLSQKITKTNKTVNTVWNALIQEMSTKGCVGEEIGTRCAAHPSISNHRLSDAASVMNLVERPELFCQVNFTAL
jgi:helicase required for RNAi-mediated heterochromatin assembly 1